MSKILFLDLDGTIREPASGEKFINDPHDQRIIEGVREAIAHYSSRKLKALCASIAPLFCC